MFTIKSDNESNEVDYNIIVERAKSILLEMNRLKKNFYVVK